MKFQVTTQDPLRYPCPVLVLGCFEGKFDDPYLAGLDKVLDGAVARLFRDKEFTGNLNGTRVIHTLGRVARS